MKPYKHFTTEERKCLQQFLSEGLSFRQIADLLERSPSTISREVNRNKAKYNPIQVYWVARQNAFAHVYDVYTDFERANDDTNICYQFFLWVYIWICFY